MATAWEWPNYQTSLSFSRNYSVMHTTESDLPLLSGLFRFHDRVFTGVDVNSNENLVLALNQWYTVYDTEIINAIRERFSRDNVNAATTDTNDPKEWFSDTFTMLGIDLDTERPVLTLTDYVNDQATYAFDAFLEGLSQPSSAMLEAMFGVLDALSDKGSYSVLDTAIGSNTINMSGLYLPLGLFFVLKEIEFRSSSSSSTQSDRDTIKDALDYILVNQIESMGSITGDATLNGFTNALLLSTTINTDAQMLLSELMLNNTHIDNFISVEESLGQVLTSSRDAFLPSDNNTNNDDNDTTDTTDTTDGDTAGNEDTTDGDTVGNEDTTDEFADDNDTDEGLGLGGILGIVIGSLVAVGITFYVVKVIQGSASKTLL